MVKKYKKVVFRNEYFLQRFFLTRFIHKNPKVLTTIPQRLENVTVSDEDDPEGFLRLTGNLIYIFYISDPENIKDLPDNWPVRKKKVKTLFSFGKEVEKNIPCFSGPINNFYLENFVVNSNEILRMVPYE